MSSCQTSNLNHKEKKNNIRKRGCSSPSPASSSSSSTSLVRRYRFKRAILVGKRGGSGTPAPMWKTRTSSPSMATHHHHQHVKEALPCSGYGVPSKEKELYVSARKLAATLWEINDLPPSRVMKEIEAEPVKNGKEKSVSLCRSGLLRASHMSDPSYSPLSERVKRVEDDSCKRRVSALSSKLHLADYSLGDLDSHGNANNIIDQVGNQPRNKKSCGKCAVGFKNRLKEARSGISTSKKLLKVLNQMCLQEQHSSSIPLILAMSSELDRVRHQIDQLSIQDQSSNQNDIEYLMKHYAEEKNVWKRRERERIRDAITSIAEELEVEKKLRRQTERLNKKIAKEMASVKASYLKVSRDLEREKRAKEILQQICDELARGIGEDRAQVEKLKRESARVREEVEKEREMLQLADVLREERVQMKLSEAKYQFEEKNAVLEKLRNELEGFLKTKEEEEENGDVDVELKKLKDLESYLSTACWEYKNPEKENGLDVGDESADSDLQSIELNMDNDNKGYKWSYVCENVAQGEPKRVSIDRDIGRKSFSERIQWGSICFNKGKGTTSGKKRDFGVNIHENSDHCDQERSIEFLVGAQIQDDEEEEEEESERYRAIMTLRECLLCASPAQGSGGQPLTLQHMDGEAEENGHTLKQEAAARKSRS